MCGHDLLQKIKWPQFDKTREGILNLWPQYIPFPPACHGLHTIYII